MNHRVLCAFAWVAFGIGIALPQSFPPDLQKYLKLTDTQIQSITDLNRQFNQYVSQQSSQKYQLQAQAQAELQKDSPDPDVVGGAYAQIETLTRDYYAQLGPFQGKVAAVLTVDQAMLVNALVGIERLQPLVTEALNACLIVVRNPFSGLNYCSVSPFPAALANYLTITDTQVIAMQSAVSSYENYTSRQDLKIQELQQQISDLTAANVIDANQLGAAYVAIENVHRDELTQFTQLTTTLRSILTDQQKPLVQTLADNVAPHQTALEAECYNILVLPKDLQNPYSYYCYGYSPSSRTTQ